MTKVIVAILLIAMFGVFAAEPSQHTFLYFGASWCQPCKRMKSDTLSEATVKKAMADLKVMFIDIDELPEMSRRYDVSSVPTYILLDSDGKEYRRGVGYKSPQEFLKWLK